MAKHKSPKLVPVALQLQYLTDELYDLIEDMQEAGYRGVEHKLQEALGKLHSAQDAAKQYESGEQTPYWPY